MNRVAGWLSVVACVLIASGSVQAQQTVGLFQDDAESCDAGRARRVLPGGGFRLWPFRADLSGHVLQGAECGIGVFGQYDWHDVPAGDLYFLSVLVDVRHHDQGRHSDLPLRGRPLRNG